MMVEKPLNFKAFVNPASLAEELAVRVEAILKDALEKKGHASLVVPGGKSPKLFFQALKKKPLDWKNIHVTITDERWVPVTSDDSNEKFLKKYLLRPESQFFGLKNTSHNPDLAKDICGNALRSFPRPFDAVILGMGEDGHIASLFPYMPNLHLALDPKSSMSYMVTRSRTEKTSRLSMTLSALLKTNHLFLLAHGGTKQNMIYKAFLSKVNKEMLPIGALIHQKKVPLEIYWAP